MIYLGRREKNIVKNISFPTIFAGFLLFQWQLFHPEDIVAPSIAYGIFREIVFPGCLLARAVREKHAFLLRPPCRILTLAMCENTFERAHPGVNTNAIYQMIYLRKRGNFVKYFDAIAFASVYTVLFFETKFLFVRLKLMEYFKFLSKIVTIMI